MQVVRTQPLHFPCISSASAIQSLALPNFLAYVGNLPTSLPSSHSHSPHPAQQPNAAQGRLMLEISRSHTMTHHSRQDFSGTVIGPPQRPLPDKHSQRTNIHAPRGIRTRNPSKRSAVNPRLRPLGHWDRHFNSHYKYNIAFGELLNVSRR